jgi:hypothetical protein
MLPVLQMLHLLQMLQMLHLLHMLDSDMDRAAWLILVSGDSKG